MTVRLRIAPSPTGNLHVGTARAALFNWLYARRHDGVFILRIDDTDRERSTPEYEANILDSLRWLGLDWDEGVGVGGPRGAYRQSERYNRYREVAESLITAGHAYYDPRTQTELEELRKRAVSEGRHPGHYIRRVEQDARKGPIRLSVPQGDPIVFEDLIRGTVTFRPEDIDDFVILRTDGTPTYHLASTVDDIDYGITHVARGEDLIPSTPKHIVLTRAVGAEPPTYAHLPLLHGTDGRKLSKRFGATSLSWYREEGYLSDAVFNYLALLGWSPGSDVTVFSREEARAVFDLADVSKNPAMFDPEKLAWLNGVYIRALPVEEFVALARPRVESAVGRSLDEMEWARFERIAPLIQERTQVLTEAGEQVRFLYSEIEQYDEPSWQKVMLTDEVEMVLSRAHDRLSALSSWDAETIEEELRAMLSDLDISARKGLQPIRVAVTGSSVSPPLFESLAALGREESLGRLERARAVVLHG